MKQMIVSLGLRHLTIWQEKVEVTGPKQQDASIWDPSDGSRQVLVLVMVLLLSIKVVK